MRQAIALSLVLLVALVSAAVTTQARELERKVPMLDDPSSRAASTGTAGPARGVFGVSQTPTDTFYYGGTVIVGGEPYAAEPSGSGWVNRKMWTWSATGFNGTPHSGLNMDGWVGVDNRTQVEDYFHVVDNATLGANCVIAGTKSLFCGATNQQCIDLCFVDQTGTGYGNNWHQTVVTKPYTYNAGNQIQLDYDYNNESEPGYDSTYAILQVYDAGAGKWVDHVQMATYTGVLGGHETIDVDSHMSGLTPPVQFRIRFTFSSDVSYSDEDGNFSTACGGVEIDNYALAWQGGSTDSENFEGVAVGGLPAGWQKIILGCGQYARVKHLNDLPVGLIEDPCFAQLGSQMCEIADSVLVLFDEGHPSYPHPSCQDNYARSPIINLSSHLAPSGRILHCERFARLPMQDLIFMYWQVRYKPGCAADGWSPWVSDDQIYYTPEGTSCRPMDFDVSAFVPPEAEQAQVGLGVINYCDADPWGDGCSYVCNATPYYDNVTFGVYGSNIAPYVSMRESDYWQDQFAEDGTLNPASTADTRTASYLSNLVPPIFGDTMTCRGTADNMEVRFVFRMAKVGPLQSTTHPFFTTWFPGVTGGGWNEARMDTSEITSTSGTSTEPVKGQWMCAFHEEDPVRIANALPECKEVLPNNLFVPGTKVEYFIKTRFIGSTDWFLLPDTTTTSPLADKFEEFSVLPMYREQYGWIAQPCLIVADHFGQRGNAEERNGHRIERHLNALGYTFDVYHKLGPSSDLRNGIGRWAANSGQLGGPGTDKYNWGSGATLSQFLGYEYCILNAGNVYSYSMYQPDVDMLSSWLNLYTSPTGISRFFWLSGDQVVRELDRRTPWGRNFLNKTLCATYVHSNYAAQNNDYAYCLPVNYVAGGMVPCGNPATQYVIRQNGCPRTYSVIGVSASTGCNAVSEREYDSQPTKRYAAISNTISVPGGASYKTFTEGYDFCVIRSDASQGPLACGTDNFLSNWFNCLLAWASYVPTNWCPPQEPPPIIPHATVKWQSLVCDSTKAFVCPASSHVPPNDTCLASWMSVSLKDQFNVPMAGVRVDAVFDSRCALHLCSPASAVTDINGEANISISAGLDARADTACCPVRTRLQALGGVTLYENTMEWLSPDMNADSVVSVEDASILTGDWGSSACRSDYNCDGVVDELDWAMFEAHYGHACKSTVVSVEGGPGARPTVTALAQNYPNPFNPLSDIEFSVARSGRVTLRVYDIAGRPVRTLVDNWREPGRYKAVWDGRDEGGELAAPGVYLYKFEAPGCTSVKKIVILR